MTRVGGDAKKKGSAMRWRSLVGGRRIWNWKLQWNRLLKMGRNTRNTTLYCLIVQCWILLRSRDRCTGPGDEGQKILKIS